MSFLKEQPIKISENALKNNSLPLNFKFKTLNLAYLDQIHNLINNHYVEDDYGIARTVYSKDFLYWYLKYIPDGFIVGLIYKNILVGMITATFLDMIIYDTQLKIPYINFLCLQSKTRKNGLGLALINEIKNRLVEIKMNNALFTGNKHFCDSFVSTQDFVVPINYSKLKNVGFLTDDITPLNACTNTIANDFHLMTKNDVKNVVIKLNKFMDSYKIKPFFNKDSASNFLLPKKKIIYSFVKKNSNGLPTDFVNVYINYLYCKEKNKLISMAHLAFYFYETLTLTDLVTCLLDKLKSYGIDQLMFRNMAQSENINITKFTTHSQTNYYLYNTALKKTNFNEFCFFPI